MAFLLFWRKNLSCLKIFILSISIVFLNDARGQETDSLGFWAFNDQVAIKVDKIDKPAPTIILIHGGAGVRASSNMMIWAFIVKGWGYNVVTVDLFSKRGFYDLSQQGRNLSFSTRANDIVDVATYITKQPWHQGGVGALGFSQGGSTVFNLGKNKQQKVVSASVAFYPACSYETPAYSPAIPTQIHFAMKDDLSIPSWCGPSFMLKKYDVHRYENASHTFDIAAERRVTPQGNVMWHDPEAFKLSQERTKDFFDRTLGR